MAKFFRLVYAAIRAFFNFLFTGGWIFNQKKYLQRAQENAPFDAVIVPGIPIKEGEWTKIMELRVGWSRYLYEQGITKHVIFSGGTCYTPYNEARAMAEYAKATGLPESAIVLEPNAEHSVENVYFSYLIAREKGWTKLGLASDPFQTAQLRPMISDLKRRKGQKIHLIPAYIKLFKTLEHPKPKLDLSHIKEDNFTPLTEKESGFERFKGTMGRNIDWDA